MNFIPFRFVQWITSTSIAKIKRPFGALVLALSTLVLSGCGFLNAGNGTFGTGPFYPPQNQGPFIITGVPGQPGAALQTPQVAVLLPLSGAHAALGQTMSQAATMAIEESTNTNVRFRVMDTGSSAAGAANAAAGAVNQGTSLILGPLLGDGLTQVAQLVGPRGVPVVGFTNDVSRAQTGAWAMGVAPQQSVERMMQWAANSGYRRIAVVYPATAYGQAAANAARSAAARYGLSLTVQQSYGLDDISKNQTAQIVGSQANAFDAVIIPDDGNSLREIASLLYFYEVEPDQKKYIGLDGWNDDTLVSEQSLVGGVYAVPPQESIADFERRFQQRFGVTPNVQAIAVYDAIKMVAELARSSALAPSASPYGLAVNPNPFGIDQLSRPQGFSGALGHFRLTRDGRVERLYQIKQITGRGIVILEPAPTGFAAGLPAG